jgi:branched-chain amino acid transport system substrate-binding protein
VFNNIFNYPANYWDGASIAINYLLSENGDSLEGKKIALIYHNSAYGKEPIRTLQELSAKHGFELTELAVDHPGQEQKSQWLQIRRERPDYVIMWGWGVMNQVAVQEAANIRFPMENFIGNWWAGSENDVTPVGAAANGYKSLNMHNVGDDFPIYADLQEYIVDAGLAAGNGDQLGTVLYNRGLYAAMLAAEAAKKAQEIHGEMNITPAMMRDGMEALVVDEALMNSLGMPDFGPEFSVSCENHGGSGRGKVQQWNAETGEWEILTDWIESDRDVIDALIEEDSMAYAAENNITPGCAES